MSENTATVTNIEMKTGAILVKKSPPPATHKGRDLSTDSPIYAYRAAVPTLVASAGDWFLIWRNPGHGKYKSRPAVLLSKERKKSPNFKIETRYDGAELYVRMTPRTTAATA